MLLSTTIQRRQSEIRQALAGIVGKTEPTADETKQMETLDAEYRGNETRYRAALIAEDTERREAKDELETRSDKEYAELVDRFQLRQVALFLDEGRALDGATAEVVAELRSNGGYRGCPIPWQALERRAGETIASGTPDPKITKPIIDRIFPSSVASRMGISLISIDSGIVEYPVATAGAVVGWQTTETGSVGSPSAYATTDKPLAPDHTLGVQMKLTRKALKQSGDALEQAVRRDMNAAMGQELDRVVFLGAGSSGEPLGVIPGAGTYNITETPVDAAASWGALREAIVNFMVANAANSPSDVKLLIRPELYSAMDELISGIAISEWDRVLKAIGAGNIVMSSNALESPLGSPLASSAVLAVTINGVAPAFMATWGAIDLIRDPYSDAASGGLRLTALATADVTVARGVQVEVLSNVHH